MLTVIHSETISEGRIIGILDTPMHPARYYAGFLRWRGAELLPTDNATCNYHRTLENAENAVYRLKNFLNPVDSAY